MIAAFLASKGTASMDETFDYLYVVIVQTPNFIWGFFFTNFFLLWGVTPHPHPPDAINR